MRLFPKIESLNLVNPNNAVAPDYDLSVREPSIELHFSPEGKICIIGRVDNNYLWWCSVTELKERETNEKIFNKLANHPFEIVSNENLVLGDAYEEVKTWYKCALTKSTRADILWETPFDRSYGKGDPENHGRYFADSIIWHYQSLVEKCQFRLDGGSFIKQLQHYREQLDEAEEYHAVKGLESILKQESYLRLSPDEGVRELYLACIERCTTLYNHYMDRAR